MCNEDIGTSICIIKKVLEIEFVTIARYAMNQM